MEDEYLKGVKAGYEKGKTLESRGQISDYAQRAMGAYTKAKRDGKKDEAYKWQGYVKGLDQAETYKAIVRAIGE